MIDHVECGNLLLSQLGSEMDDLDDISRLRSQQGLWCPGDIGQGGVEGDGLGLGNRRSGDAMV